MTILKHTYQVEVITEETNKVDGYLIIRTRRPHNIYSEIKKLYKFNGSYLGKVTKII